MNYHFASLKTSVLGYSMMSNFLISSDEIIEHNVIKMIILSNLDVFSDLNSDALDDIFNNNIQLQKDFKRLHEQILDEYLSSNDIKLTHVHWGEMLFEILNDDPTSISEFIISNLTNLNLEFNGFSIQIDTIELTDINSKLYHDMKPLFNDDNTFHI